MKNINISRNFFIVVLLIFLLNVIISTTNVIEDRTLLLRVIPIVSWSIAAIVWIAAYLRKAGGKN